MNELGLPSHLNTELIDIFRDVENIFEIYICRLGQQKYQLNAGNLDIRWISVMHIAGRVVVGLQKVSLTILIIQSSVFHDNDFAP
jgi:hypothetical protein